MVRPDIQRIKEKNEEEFELLILAANLYAENKKGDNIEAVEKHTLEVITSILDKHGVKYVNDLC